MSRLAWVVPVLVFTAGCGRKPPHEGRSVAELERMLDDPSPTVRVQGAYGLSLLGPDARSAVPALVQALGSPDALLRAQAAMALGKIGPDARDAVGRLAEALNDAEWTVRRQAALALAEVGPEARSAVPGLRQLERADASGLVRKAARQALARLEN